MNTVLHSKRPTLENKKVSVSTWSNVNAAVRFLRMWSTDRKYTILRKASGETKPTFFGQVDRLKRAQRVKFGQMMNQNYINDRAKRSKKREAKLRAKNYNFKYLGAKLRAFSFASLIHFK